MRDFRFSQHLDLLMSDAMLLAE